MATSVLKIDEHFQFSFVKVGFLIENEYSFWNFALPSSGFSHSVTNNPKTLATPIFNINNDYNMTVVYVPMYRTFNIYMYIMIIP